MTEIDIDDANLPTFKTLLKYIYSNTWEDTNMTSYKQKSELMKMAHKYKLSELKTQIGDSIVQDIDETNAVDALILAVKVSNGQMEESLGRFICDNLIHIEDQESWRMLLENHPKIAQKVLQSN